MSPKFQPSRRAIATYKQGPAWELMQKVKQRPQWQPESQPDGIINLSGALNSLMNDWMESYVATLPPLNSFSAVQYGPIFGSSSLLNAAAGFFNTFFHPHQHVSAEDILAANGVTSLIDMIAWTLCEPGEGVVYLTPNFYMLEYDLSARAGATAIPVSTASLGDSFGAIGIEALVRLLESAVEEAESTRQIRCRVLFICNPTNPQGRCYSTQTLQALASWCKQRAMHLVADEIYAMSIYGDSHTNESSSTFSSVLSIPSLGNDNLDAGGPPQNVHCLYGLSKDFNMGGLRMAFLVTKNAAVRAAASRVAWFTWLTAFSDSFVSRFLENQDTVRTYLTLYQQRLKSAYLTTAECLAEYNIPFEPSEAGLFIFINLSTWLKHLQGHDDPGSDAGELSRELQLCDWLIYHGVFLNAGEFAGSDRPGHFRLVFTGDADATKIAVQRIRTALNALESAQQEVSVGKTSGRTTQEYCK